MELHILSDTDEPCDVSAGPLASAPAESRVRTNFRDLSARLQTTGFGRAMLCCMQWVVVFSLISAGYFGAAAINVGVECATGDKTPTANTPNMLAVSSPRN